MSLLWAIPPVAVVVGMVVVVIGLRAIGSIATEVQQQLVQLAEVRAAVARVRDEQMTTQTTLERIRTR
jgi:hypothetical protein